MSKEQTNSAEILKKVTALKAELSSLKLQKKMIQLEKPHKLSLLRKEIAKLLTSVNAR